MLHHPEKRVDVVAEEWRQSNEPGAQVSSQPKIEKMKQSSGKREQATSPQRNIINTGKFIFESKQAHLPKLSNLQ